MEYNTTQQTKIVCEEIMNSLDKYTPYGATAARHAAGLSQNIASQAIEYRTYSSPPTQKKCRISAF